MSSYSMPSSAYNSYLPAIKAANASEDKESLRQIKKQPISRWGPNDRDVEYPLRQFRYNV